MEKKLSKEEKIEVILEWYDVEEWYGAGTAEDIVDGVRQYLVCGGKYLRGMNDWSDEEIDDEYETATGEYAARNGHF
jgi:hypothetical protein